MNDPLTPSQVMMLTALFCTPGREHGRRFVGNFWDLWKGQRHDLYKRGLLKKNENGECVLTEKGEALVERILKTPDPVKITVTKEEWGFPEAA